MYERLKSFLYHLQIKNIFLLATIFLFLFFSPSNLWAESFRARLVEDLGSLDWNNGEVNQEIVLQLMEGLFRSDHNGNPELAVAKKFEWNQDKTNLHIILKVNKKWSDGKPVCAEHFVNSWQRLRSKEFASPYAHYANILKAFKAKGCLELDIEFNRPSPEALALFSHYVFFPLRKENLLEGLFQSGKKLLVNGAFRVSDWQKNKFLRLERNKFYPTKSNRVDKIEFIFVPDESTAKTMFETKKIDWMKDIPLLLRANFDKEIKTFPTFVEYYFGLNSTKSKLLQDLDIRHALSLALHRDEIEKILGIECKGVSEWGSFWLQGRKSLVSEVEKKASVDLLERAKKKLAAGNKNELVLRVYNKSAHRLLAEWAQGQWEKYLGIRIPVEVQEGKVYWHEISTHPSPIFFGGVTAPYGHPRAFYQEFLSTSSANWTGWKSPEYDQAVMSENFGKAEEILTAAGYIIPLYKKSTTVLIQPKWKNFFLNPLGQMYLSEL